MMHLVEDSNNSLAIQFPMETALWLKKIPFKWGIKLSNPTTTQTIVLPEYMWLLKVCRFSVKIRCYRTYFKNSQTKI